MSEQPYQELILLITEGDSEQFSRALQALCISSAEEIHEVVCAAALSAPLERQPYLCSLMNGPATDELAERLRQSMNSSDQDVRVEAALAAARMVSHSPRTVRLKLLALFAILPANDVPPLLEVGLSRLSCAPYADLWDAVCVSFPVLAVRCLADAMDTHRDAASAECILFRVASLELMTAALRDPAVVSMSPVVGLVANRLTAEGELDSDVEGGPWQQCLEALVVAYADSSGAQGRIAIVSGLEAMGPGVVDCLASWLAQADVERAELLSRILEKLEWEPKPDLSGVRYWISKSQFDRCADAGSLAIEPLRAVFLGEDLERRDGAARTLDRLGWAPADEEVVMPFLAALGRWNQLPLVTSRAGEVFEAMMDHECRAAQEKGWAYRQAVRREMVSVAENVLDPKPRFRMLRQVLLTDPSNQIRLDALDALVDLDMSAELAQESLAHELWLVRHTSTAEPDAALRSRLVAFLMEKVETLMDAPSLEALLQAALDEPKPALRASISAALLAMHGATPETFWPAIQHVLERERWQSTGSILNAIGDESLEWLLGQEGSAPNAGQHVALGLAAGILAGCDWCAAVDALWLTDDPSKWETAARVYDLIEDYPSDPGMLAAYWIARGDLDECRRIGAPAVPTLQRALKMGDVIGQGEIASMLVEMGCAPERKVLDSLRKELRLLAAQPDQPIEQVPAGDAGRSVTLTVSNEQGRVQARRLLERLGLGA